MSVLFCIFIASFQLCLWLIDMSVFNWYIPAKKNKKKKKKKKKKKQQQ